MERLIWAVAAFWVVRLIWNFYRDVQKNLQAGRSTEDLPAQKGRGIFSSSGPTWEELLRMGRELKQKTPPKDRFDAPNRYSKNPKTQPKNPRKQSKVKQRAGWFN